MSRVDPAIRVIVTQDTVLPMAVPLRLRTHLPVHNLRAESKSVAPRDFIIHIVCSLSSSFFTQVWPNVQCGSSKLAPQAAPPCSHAGLRTLSLCLIYETRDLVPVLVLSIPGD